MANKLHLAIGLIIVVIAFIGLYVYFSSAPAAAPVQNETAVLNVEVNKTNTTEITLNGAYWGSSTKPADYNETCSNETRNRADGFTFTVEAETSIDAPNYDACYIVNNGHRQQTAVVEMHDAYMNVQAKSETDRRNMVGICCQLDDRLDCSNFTALLQCPLE
jgi:hypothetical protein